MDFAVCCFNRGRADRIGCGDKREEAMPFMTDQTIQWTVQRHEEPDGNLIEYVVIASLAHNDGVAGCHLSSMLHQCIQSIDRWPPIHRI